MNPVRPGCKSQVAAGKDEGMSLDYNSLLLAVGFSAACLCMTLFGIWLTARSEKFLLTWAVSVLLIVADEIGRAHV